MAFHVLTAAWKAHTFVDDGSKLSITDKCVFARLADAVRAETGVAAISMEDLTESCSGTEPTIRESLSRLMKHGCVCIATAATHTRARRYSLDLTRALSRPKAADRHGAARPAVTLDGLAADVLERKRERESGLPPRGQLAFPVEGKPLTPQGESGLPRSGSSVVSGFSDFPKKASGAHAPPVFNGKKPKRKPLKAGQTGAAPANKYPHMTNEGGLRAKG